jgi:hypothetical protein
VSDCKEPIDKEDGALCKEHKDSHWTCPCGHAFIEDLESKRPGQNGCFDCGTAGDSDSWLFNCYDPTVHENEFMGDMPGLIEHIRAAHNVEVPKIPRNYYFTCEFCEQPGTWLLPQYVDHLVRVHGFKRCPDSKCNSIRAYDPVGYHRHLFNEHGWRPCRGCRADVLVKDPNSELCAKCDKSGQFWFCSNTGKCERLLEIGEHQGCPCGGRWKCPVKGCNKAQFRSKQALFEHAGDYHNWRPCSECNLRVHPAKDRCCSKCRVLGVPAEWYCPWCPMKNGKEFAECQNYESCPSHLQVPSKDGEWFCANCQAVHDCTVLVCKEHHKGCGQAFTQAEQDIALCGCQWQYPPWNLGGPHRREAYEFNCPDEACEFHTDDEALYKEHQHFVHNAWGMEGAASGASAAAST